MFKVTFMCDDAKLGKALRVLVGVAAEPPQALPVANAVVKKGAVSQKVPGQTLPDLIKNTILGDVDKRTYTMNDIKMIVTQLGYAPASVNNAFWRLYNQEKFLRRVSRGVYEVRH